MDRFHFNFQAYFEAYAVKSFAQLALCLSGWVGELLIVR